MNSALRRLHPRGGKIRLQRLGIAVNEIKDAVPAGVHACDQVRPSDGALRRNAGGEETERSMLRESGKVRHLALGHEFLQQLRIHAVNPKNDELLIALP